MLYIYLIFLNLAGDLGFDLDLEMRSITQYISYKLYVIVLEREKAANLLHDRMPSGSGQKPNFSNSVHSCTCAEGRSGPHYFRA